MQDADIYRFADDRLAEALAALERLRGASRMAAEPALSAIAEARHGLGDALRGRGFSDAATVRTD